MKLFGFKKTLDGFAQKASRTELALYTAIGIIFVLAIKILFQGEIIILQPPEMSETAKITKKNATQNYYTAWALAIAELVGNASPTNIDFVKDQVRNLATTDLYTTISASIDNEVEKIKRDQVAQRFEARGVSFEPDTDKLFVYGVLIGIGIMDNQVKHDFTYEVKLAIDHYRVKLTAMRGYSGRPLTLDVLQDKEATEDRINKARKPEDK